MWGKEKYKVRLIYSICIIIYLNKIFEVHRKSFENVTEMHITCKEINISESNTEFNIKIIQCYTYSIRENPKLSYAQSF